MNVVAKVLAASLLVFPTSLLAKDSKHPSLPEQVITAKTVYIDNQSEDTSIGAKASEELKKWGRFQLVPDGTQADLIFRFTTGEYTSYATNNPPNTTEVKAGYTYLTIIDSKSGEHLWNASQKWGNVYGGYHSATRGLIETLKKQIDEQLGGSPGCCDKKH